MDTVPVFRLLRRSSSLTVSLAVLLLIAMAQVTVSDAQTAEQQKEVNTRMNDLVDSVKDAVHDAEAAAGRKQVIDLGQSLHMMETKFSGLRAALMQELGASASRMTSHAGLSNDLLDRTAKLVKSIVKQRDELRRLSGDVREVDSAIRALREGLNTFENEVNDLKKVMGELHVSHNELSTTHADAKHRLKTIMDNHKKNSTSMLHRFMYVLLFLEVVGFAVFLFLKRPGRAMAHKAYGKFG